MCLLKDVSLKFEGMFRRLETHMVWNVKIFIGQPDTVPAHLVDQVLPDDYNLLAAVLNPEKETHGRSLLVFKSREKSQI